MIREISSVLAFVVGIVIIALCIEIYLNLKKEKLVTAKLFLNKNRVHRAFLALFWGTFSFLIFSILLTFNIEFSERFLIMWVYWLSFLYFGYQFRSIMG